MIALMWFLSVISALVLKRPIDRSNPTDVSVARPAVMIYALMSPRHSPDPRGRQIREGGYLVGPCRCVSHQLHGGELLRGALL